MLGIVLPGAPVTGPSPGGARSTPCGRRKHRNLSTRRAAIAH